MMMRKILQWPVAVALLIASIGGVLAGAGPTIASQNATPASTWSCANATPVDNTPMASMAMGTPRAGTGHADMAAGTPDAEVEFDQLYIDMMIPHHRSIVALATVALPELTDPRLVEIAENIIDTQRAEVERLMNLREEWYGSAEPAAMDTMYMEQTLEAMPSIDASMEVMQHLMSPEWEVATFCASDNPDLAFIEQAIPHHQMAVNASKDAVEKAVHPELVEIAQDVIESQQAQIDTLQTIRAEFTGKATPAS